MYQPKSNFQLRPFIICLLVMMVVGCQSNKCDPPNLGCDPNRLLPAGDSPTYLQEGNEPCIEDCGPIDTSFSPLSTSNYNELSYQDMSLDNCISLALQNSKVFRDLGGTIISSPQNIDGIFDPAIVTSDPRFSEEAALSAFDANFSTAAFFQNNDQASNLTFQGNNGIFRQDFHDYQTSIQKLAATGTLFTLSNLTNYDNSNQTGQTLPHSWQTIFQGEFRHPLLQGSGTIFNRIAGPSTQPGVYGGVLIARTNSEISLSQFREGVRDLVSEVENAYWDLYFAYRNLKATIEGRDKAYEILVETTEGKSREGSQAQAQAREQYLRFERDVLDAMEGRPTFGTRNNNGMAGGVFLSNGGVRVTERRLRLICGLPINGPDLLRTTDQPASTGIQFDWDQSVFEAFNGRQELLQQRWLIKQRELQLLASKNFLKPRFDLIGQYRFRGLGRSLTGGSTTFQDDLRNGTMNSSALGDLTNGDFQEWQVGAEFSMPIGFRAAHLGVRNAELALSRERNILHEQKREVIFGLSNAFGELRRTFAALTAAEEQYVAAREFQYVMKLEVERGRDRDIELEAQRRAVDAEIQFRRAQVEYMLALKNIHFEKGTYLDFCNVRLSESQSNPQATIDVTERQARRGMRLSYVTDQPNIAKKVPKFAPTMATEDIITTEGPVEFITEINESPFIDNQIDNQNNQATVPDSTASTAGSNNEIQDIQNLMPRAPFRNTTPQATNPAPSRPLETTENAKALPSYTFSPPNTKPVWPTNSTVITNASTPLPPTPRKSTWDPAKTIPATSPSNSGHSFNFSDAPSSPKTNSNILKPLTMTTPANKNINTTNKLPSKAQTIPSSSRRSTDANRKVNFNQSKPLQPVTNADQQAAVKLQNTSSRRQR